MASLVSDPPLSQYQMSPGVSRQLQKSVAALLCKDAEVFEEGLGMIRVFEAGLELKPGSKPRFSKARPVPFALQGAIERELERLEKAGIVEKIDHSPRQHPLFQFPRRMDI